MRSGVLGTGGEAAASKELRKMWPGGRRKPRRRCVPEGRWRPYFRKEGVSAVSRAAAADQVT